MVEQFVIFKTCSLYVLLGVRLDICIAATFEHQTKIELFFIMICVKSFLSSIGLWRLQWITDIKPRLYLDCMDSTSGEPW